MGAALRSFAALALAAMALGCPKSRSDDASSRPLAAAALPSARPPLPADAASDSSPPPAVSASSRPPRARAPLDAQMFDLARPDDDVFTRENPDATTLDRALLAKMLGEAAAQQSDAMLVAMGDTLLVEKYFGKSPEKGAVQSVTKTVTALAIGALVDEGKIASVDTPVSTYFPEWAGGGKGPVTLRHLLSHSSGLSDDGTLFSEPNGLAYARARPLGYRSGAGFSYSNAGFMLLAGVIAQAAGKDAEAYVAETLFAPMGITAWRWVRDGAGNVLTPSGLFLFPRDLLRIGRLLRDRGTWDERMLVPRDWVAAMIAEPPGTFPCYGLGVWLLRDGCDDVAGVTGKLGPILGPIADGWGGNYIVVDTDAAIIGVRTKVPGLFASRAEERKTAYDAFPHRVAKLTR